MTLLRIGSVGCVLALVVGGVSDAGAAEETRKPFRMGVGLGLGMLTVARSADAANGRFRGEEPYTALHVAVDAEWFVGRLGVGPRLSGTSGQEGYSGLDLTLQASLPLVEAGEAGTRVVLGVGPAVARTFEPPSFAVQREQGIPFGWCGWLGLDVTAADPGRIQPSLELRLDARSLEFSERMTNTSGEVATGRGQLTSLGVFVLGGLSF